MLLTGNLDNFTAEQEEIAGQVSCVHQLQGVVGFAISGKEPQIPVAYS